MKFWAKVKLKGDKNAGELIRAFFEEFNPESSILIKGEEAKVEIIFETTPPMASIAAINCCEVMEFYFGKALGEYSEEEIKQEVKKEVSEAGECETIQKQTKNETVFEQIDKAGNETKQPKKKRGRQARNTTKKTVKDLEPKELHISQLEEIAEKSTSFEHFVKSVAEWLEMSERQNFFESLVYATTIVEKISWKEIENELNKKGVNYTSWDKIWTGQQVSKKLEETSVTLFPFLKAMKNYKDYSFGHEKEISDKDSAEEVSAFSEEDTATVNRKKMECMPEIPAFEETLGNLDKMLPVEEQVKYVLSAMGWNNLNPKEKNIIFEMANTAVRLTDVSLVAVFSKLNIPIKSTVEENKAIMTFSQFINDFTKVYDSEKKVKLVNFLKDLKEIIT